MTAHDPSRRGFLAAAGTAAAVATHGDVARAYAAGNTINVACIGTGGRCRTLMQSLAKVPDVRLAAVCDIYDGHIDAARKIADPKAIVSRRYKELLERKDIDAVLIGSPDHWHVPMTIDALAAGKDVYVEKPLTHSLAEGKAVIAAQQRSGKIVQVGTQQRSMPQFLKARELLKAGRIGDVFKVHLTWNRNADRLRKRPLGIDANKVDWKEFLGNARPQPYDEYRFRNWRWFWDFGNGILTDLMVHFIDVVHWFLDLDHPERAVTVGSQFMSEGVWETPDTIQTVLQYPGGLQVYFEGTFSNARNGAMLEFMGTDATLYLDRGRYEIHPERNKGVAEQWVLGDGKRGADFYNLPDGELLHLTNWIDCVRSRKVPHCPVEAGVSAAGAAHLGNIAYRTGQTALWKDHAR